MPALSVVIAALDPSPAIFDCLAALLADGDLDLEVLVVVDDSQSGGGAMVRRHFPEVRVLEAASGASLPCLRGTGIAEAAGRIIAILDPSCLIEDGWRSAVMDAHAARVEPAVGGPVEPYQPEDVSLIGWATFLFDYWEFVRPYAGGPTTVLSGNNISYKRDALGDLNRFRTSGFWKAFVNAALTANGGLLWAVERAGVRLQRTLSFMGFLRSRYHHGRSYAAMRVAGAGRLSRWFRLLTTPLLPPVFLARQAHRLLPMSGYRWPFLRCAPLLVLFHVSWAVGEAWGYAAGAGRSHDAIRY